MQVHLHCDGYLPLRRRLRLGVLLAGLILIPTPFLKLRFCFVYFFPLFSNLLTFYFFLNFAGFLSYSYENTPDIFRFYTLLFVFFKWDLVIWTWEC